MANIINLDEKRKERELYSTGPIRQGRNSEPGKGRYPLIGDTGEFMPFIGSSIASWGFSKLADYVQPTSKIKRIIKRSFESMAKSYSQKREISGNNFSPLGGALVDLWNGGDDMEALYVTKYPLNGKDAPVYIQRKGHKLPADLDETLEKNIKYMMDEAESPYNDQNLEEFFNQRFQEPGADFITKGEYPDKLIDPGRVKKWFVRDYTAVWRAYGNVTETRTVTVDGISYTVEKYEAPSNWEKLKWGAIFAGMWRLTNIPFAPAKKGADIASREFGQVFREEQYKVCHNLTWAILGRPEYGFDFTKVA